LFKNITYKKIFASSNNFFTTFKKEQLLFKKMLLFEVKGNQPSSLKNINLNKNHNYDTG